jgi:hypothetical protein
LRRGCCSNGSTKRLGCAHGGVRERSNRAVLKTAGRASVPWVQIPPPPFKPAPVPVVERQVSATAVSGVDSPSPGWSCSSWRARPSSPREECSESLAPPSATPATASQGLPGHLDEHLRDQAHDDEQYRHLGLRTAVAIVTEAGVNTKFELLIGMAGSTCWPRSTGTLGPGCSSCRCLPASRRTTLVIRHRTGEIHHPSEAYAGSARRASNEGVKVSRGQPIITATGFRRQARDGGEIRC